MIPPFDPDDPGPLVSWEVKPTTRVTPAVATLITDVLSARWLGSSAAEAGVADECRPLVDPSIVGEYDLGVSMPGAVRAPASMEPKERQRLRRVIKARGGEKERGDPPSALPCAIVSIVQVADIGIDTRYIVTLEAKGRRAHLRDLKASDLLNFERVRPIALDARMVLPRLAKGQDSLWLDEVGRAMDVAEVVDADEEGTEARELRQRMSDIARVARTWTYGEDTPRPEGIMRVAHDGRVGWTRGPMLDELRRVSGSLNRTALRRAREALGWSAEEWQIPTGEDRVFVRVWGCKADEWDQENGCPARR